MVTTLKSFALHRQSLVVGLVFAILSIMIGSWITRIPEIQVRLGLSEGQLGLALLGSSIGGLLIMPFTAFIMSKISMGKTLFLSTLLFCVSMTLPVAANTYFMLIVTLVLVGLTTGVMNVAMNAAAASVETTYHRRIMSTCHGMFSLGAMFGALIGSIIAGTGASPELHLTGVGILMIILLFAMRQTLVELPETKHEEEALFVLPKGPIVGLAIIGFAVMIGEGAVADWSAVYLRNDLGSSPFAVGLGFAGFSLAMALGRFMGDSIVSNWGSKAVVRGGSLLGAFGIALVVLIPTTSVAIVGFTLVGIGFSSIVPILFSAAARTEGIPSEVGISGVTTAGMFGFLLGPPLIGFIAEEMSLSIGLTFVGVLALFAAFMAHRRTW